MIHALTREGFHHREKINGMLNIFILKMSIEEKLVRHMSESNIALPNAQFVN
ncbi:hypothetical protein [Vibrio penaeicida]|uniref:hypothetical protein n=1 Tax=Vibrio penaeicida TaxID=104609 RepID=UPI00142D9E05|nr:hypothetical protein [Vibrio penaeicida]